MATRWLKSLGVLAPDSAALIQNAKVYDLAMALQDGTVLCETCNKISAGTIKNFHAKPEKQFLKIQNINLFVTTCTAVFGLKPADMFTAEELYYASNFAKVVTVLSLLSRTPAAASKFQSFPRESERAANTAEEDGEDMYQALESLVGQSINFAEAAAPLPLPLDPDDDAEATEIYGQLRASVEELEGSEEVYTDIIYGKVEPIYAAGGTQDEKRNCVLNELLDTERNYVKLLKMIIDVFMKTVMANPKTISRAECQLIFSNIEDLFSAHTAFLAKLEQQMQSHTGRLVSGCFLEAIKSFRCYGRFCCEIPEAVTKLKELCAKPAVEKVLEQARVASQQRFGLKDLLNVPMQRILKYPLLLKELIKHTSASHADKAGLANAHVAVEELAKYINDTKKEQETLKSIIAGVKNYSGRPLQSYGQLVRDGDVTYRLQTSKDRAKIRYAFLFNNGIVVCKSKGAFYYFKVAVDFDMVDCEIQDATLSMVTKDDMEGKHSFCWVLTCRKGSSSVSHIFGVKSQALKKKWMGEMQAQLDRKSSPPALVPRVASATLLKTGTLQPPRPAPAAPAAAVSLPPSSPAPPPAGKAAYEQWAVQEGFAQASTPAPGAALATTDERWFAGKLPRAKADRVLEAAPNGTYLVRESDSRPGDYSLSVKYNLVKHIKISRRGNKYEIAPDAKPFLTIQDLITHFQQHSLHRHFPLMETVLQTPFRDALARISTADPSAASAPAGVGRARSRFPYVAKSFDELSFERGVEICVLSMAEVDPGWWRGSLPDGSTGIFPANYVQLL